MEIIEPLKCDTLNKCYIEEGEKKDNGIVIPKINSNLIIKINKWFKDHIDKDNLINSITYIINNQNIDTLDYSNINIKLINSFEHQRNEILFLLVKYVEVNFPNFNDLYIFRIYNILDRYIYNNFVQLEKEKLLQIILAAYKIVSKYDNTIIQIKNQSEINKIEIDIYQKLGFNFNYITHIEIFEIIWSIINNNNKKEETYYYSLLILILILTSINILKNDKISVVCSVLIYASEITGYTINRKLLDEVFLLNKNKIITLIKMIKKMIGNIIKNKQFYYLHRMLEQFHIVRQRFY